MSDINIMPVDDLREHVESVDCHCNPTVKVEGADLIIIHNSYDHREIVEQAVDIMNDDDGKESHDPL